MRALLCGLPSLLTQKLQRIQNAAARIITRTSRSAHVTPVLFLLHWLPVCQRIQFKVLLIVFKAKCGTGPAYLQELIQPYRQGRELRLSSHHLLNVPFTKSTVISNRAFGVAGPALWNKLPRDIRAINTLTVFKSRLKAHLFTEYYRNV